MRTHVVKIKLQSDLFLVLTLRSKCHTMMTFDDEYDQRLAADYEIEAFS